jgi:hypothetical protein
MFDIVAPDEHELALAIEAECIDEAKPRLSRPSARYAQAMGEHEPIKNRKDDKRGDAARQQESDLNDPIICERKLIQPLHAQSKTPAPSGRQLLFGFGFRTATSPRAREARSAATE